MLTAIQRKRWGIRPSLSLDFTAGLDPRITFTRASTGTYVGADGLIATASTNIPRIQYSSAGVCQGLLVEEARTNLSTYSATFDGAGWAKDTGTLTASAATAPDGANSAYKWVPGNATTNAAVYRAGGGPAISSSTTYTMSVYAKSFGRQYARVEVDWTGAAKFAWFDLTNGILGTIQSGLTATITSAGSGWYRITITAISGGAVTQAQFAYSCSAADNASGTGDGTNGIYLWGAQLEAASTASSYIPTTSASVTRSADVASMPVGSWFNSRQGTWVAGFVSNQSSTFAVVASFDDGSQNNRIALQRNSDDSARTNITSGGSDSVNGFGSTITAGSIYKYGVAWSSANSTSAINGATFGVVNGITVPAVTTLQIGNRIGSQAFFNGAIKSIRYYPRRLPDTMLQGLTR